MFHNIRISFAPRLDPSRFRACSITYINNSIFSLFARFCSSARAHAAIFFFSQRLEEQNAEISNSPNQKCLCAGTVTRVNSRRSPFVLLGLPSYTFPLFSPPFSLSIYLPVYRTLVRKGYLARETSKRNKKSRGAAEKTRERKREDDGCNNPSPPAPVFAMYYFYIE